MDAPGQTPPVDFCNRDDPRARLSNRLNPARPTRGRPRARLTRARPFRVYARSSWVTSLSRGRSAEVSPARDVDRIAALRSSPGDRSPRELYPDRIRSDTSCRRPETPQTWRAYAASAEKRLFRASPATAACATIALQGRLTHPPAKRSTIRRTRGAFRRRTSPGGDRPGWSTRCTQPVDCLGPAPFLPPRVRAN
jgi:hypothetical protein